MKRSQSSGGVGGDGGVGGMTFILAGPPATQWHAPLISDIARTNVCFRRKCVKVAVRR